MTHTEAKKEIARLYPEASISLTGLEAMDVATIDWVNILEDAEVVVKLKKTIGDSINYGSYCSVGNGGGYTVPNGSREVIETCPKNQLLLETDVTIIELAARWFNILDQYGRSRYLNGLTWKGSGQAGGYSLPHAYIKAPS